VSQAFGDVAQASGALPSQRTRTLAIGYARAIRSWATSSRSWRGAALGRRACPRWDHRRRWWHAMQCCQRSHDIPTGNARHGTSRMPNDGCARPISRSKKRSYGERPHANWSASRRRLIKRRRCMGPPKRHKLSVDSRRMRYPLPSNTHIGNRCSCVALVRVPIAANIARSNWVWHEDTCFKH
jgi:hypothetical protein